MDRRKQKTRRNQPFRFVSERTRTLANGFWRMGWDSNPRHGCPCAGFQDRCLKPLGHPSGVLDSKESARRPLRRRGRRIVGRIRARSCTRVTYDLVRQEAAADARCFTRLCNHQQERRTLLSQQLERFLRTSIRSVWEVELLLLLHQEPSRSWSVVELIRQLRASSLIINDALIALQRVELV